MRIRSHYYLVPGQIAVERRGAIVWVGRLGMIPEYREGDTLLVSDVDYEDIKKQTAKIA